jgi:negative regulator of replication initiation
MTTKKSKGSSGSDLERRILGGPLTFAAAVPAHNRLSAAATADGPVLTRLNRVHLVRSLVWSAETALAAVLLVR